MTHFCEMQLRFIKHIQSIFNFRSHDSELGNTIRNWVMTVILYYGTMETSSKNLRHCINTKIHQIFPKLSRCHLYVVSHSLESQNAGVTDVKKGLY